MIIFNYNPFDIKSDIFMIDSDGRTRLDRITSNLSQIPDILSIVMDDNNDYCLKLYCQKDLGQRLAQAIKENFNNRRLDLDIEVKDV